MNYWIDSHAHLYVERFDEDIDQVIENALSNQVRKVILPNIDLASLERMRNLTLRFPEVCFPTVGLHPCDVKANFEQVLSEMEKLAFEPENFFQSPIYAIGETGLDYYWDTTFKEQQKQALRIQIQWAKDLKLPIILHTRESIRDTIDIVKELHDESLKGVFHCFTGNLEEAEEILELDNFYLGVDGPITYKKSHLPEVFKHIPLERILLETDSPYLPPVPYRGKRNESSYLPYIGQKLADVKECLIEEVQVQTTLNCGRLFGI